MTYLLTIGLEKRNKPDSISTVIYLLFRAHIHIEVNIIYIIPTRLHKCPASVIRIFMRVQVCTSIYKSPSVYECGIYASVYEVELKKQKTLKKQFLYYYENKNNYLLILQII